MEIQPVFVKLAVKKKDDKCYTCHRKKVRMKRGGTVDSFCNNKSCSFYIDVDNIHPWERTADPLTRG